MKQTINFEIQDEETATLFYEFLKDSPDQFEILDDSDEAGVFLKKKAKTVILDIAKVSLPALISGIFLLFSQSSESKKNENNQNERPIIVVIQTDKGDFLLNTPKDTLPKIEEISKIKIIRK